MQGVVGCMATMHVHARLCQGHISARAAGARLSETCLDGMSDHPHLSELTVAYNASISMPAGPHAIPMPTLFNKLSLGIQDLGFLFSRQGGGGGGGGGGGDP